MAHTAAVKLADDVWRIPTAPADLVNTFALVDPDGRVTLVDASTSFGVGRIADGLTAMGKHVSDVRRIVLTHAHSDHAGGAAKLVELTGVDGVTVHSDDAGFVRRGEPAPRDRTLGGWRSLVARAPFGSFPAAPVSTELTGGDVLDVAGGLEVHHTPGHSPGHVSLLHRPSGVLITGDSIWNMFSRRSWPVLAFCSDARLSQQTADVLGELDYDVAAFTHGPEIRDDAREAVRGFLRKARRR